MTDLPSDQIAASSQLADNLACLNDSLYEAAIKQRKDVPAQDWITSEHCAFLLRNALLDIYDDVDIWAMQRQIDYINDNEMCVAEFQKLYYFGAGGGVSRGSCNMDQTDFQSAWSTDPDPQMDIDRDWLSPYPGPWVKIDEDKTGQNIGEGLFNRSFRFWLEVMGDRHTAPVARDLQIEAQRILISNQTASSAKGPAPRVRL